MLVKCSLDTLDENISHSVTLVPRLEYSLNILSEITQILTKTRNEIKKSNKTIDFDENDKTHLQLLETERIVAFTIEVLSLTKNMMSQISGVNSIPEVLPSTIPMIRTVSAQLYNIVPQCSQKLSELSVHLGSIVLDSAVLTKARFDFSQSNEESAALLDKVKLMVDSKISKQYPNLDFFKLCNT